MRLLVASLAFALGSIVGACADPKEEDLGTFPCGDEECDVRSEICYVDDPCDGTVGAQSCHDAPAACDGRTTQACVSTGGLGCARGPEGGFGCSPSCG